MRILCDVDGVLANFVSAYLEETSLLPEDILARDIESFLSEHERVVANRRLQKKSFCLDIKLYKDACRFYHQLLRFGEVTFITAPSNTHFWHAERVLWLEQHFDEYSFNNTVFCPSELKPLFSGDVLIEDDAATLEGWCKANPLGIGVLLDRPWNSGIPFAPKNEVRAADYSEVLRVIESRKEKATI